MFKIPLTLVVLMAVISIFSSPTHSSPSCLEGIGEELRQLSRIPVNFFQLASSPLEWERGEWLAAGSIAGTTVALFAMDSKIQSWSQDNRTQITENISRLVKPFGEGTTTLPLLGGLYLYGILEKDEKARETALLATESFFIAGFFSEAVKFTFQRHRPSTGSPPMTFDGPGLPRDNQSFASGHACVAFAVATVIAEKYSHNTLVRTAAYTLAGLTAISRVHDNDHWTSDVFFGSALGHFAARGVLKLHEGNKNFQLQATERGIQVSFSF